MLRRAILFRNFRKSYHTGAERFKYEARLISTETARSQVSPERAVDLKPYPAIPFFSVGLARCIRVRKVA
jgi:hypothetical protein